MDDSELLLAYMYIPKPIEQQLALHELGTLLEVYKWGWQLKKDHSIKPRMWIIAVVSLVIAILSSMFAISALQYTHIFYRWLFVIPLLSWVMFIYTLLSLFRPTLCVCAFSNGFVYAKNTHVTVLLWSEIKSLKQQKIKAYPQPGVALRLAISTNDGRVFKLKAPFAQLEDMGKIIKEKIASS